MGKEGPALDRGPAGAAEEGDPEVTGSPGQGTPHRDLPGRCPRTE